MELILAIRDLSNDGRGVAREDSGRTVFVAGALAGEKVRARLTGARKSYAQAEAIEILEPSPDRVSPRCAHFGECGGCLLQHLAPEAQTKARVGWLARELRALGDGLDIRPEPGPAWGWRARLRFQIHQGELGFFAPGSHRLVPIHECPIAHPAIAGALGGLAPLASVPGANWLEVLAGQEGDLWLALGLDRGGPPGPRSYQTLEQAAKALGARGPRLLGPGWRDPWDPDQQGGAEWFREDGLCLRAYPGLFSQVNPAMNRVLIGLVRRYAAQVPDGPALDLFAGCGNFALPLAADGREVTAVESEPEAAAACAAQAAQAGLEAPEFLVGDAGEELAALAEEGRSFSLVVLDPPRAGAKGLMPGLVALAPRMILYISCHPAALARDVLELGTHGYTPRGVHALDMFPHAGHQEALCVLERS